MVIADPYAVLGVGRTASDAELKAAHRALVLQHHPDLKPTAEQAAATRRVQDINVAYGMVRDPAHRARIDRLLAAAETPAVAADWDAAFAEAGRWAGRWWLRHRGGLARGARAAQRAALGTVGRVVWLTCAAGGAVIGFAASYSGARLVVEQPLFATLAGALGGILLGSEYGVRLAGRLSGDRVAARFPRLLLLAWLVAVGAGVAVDWWIA